VIPTASRFHNRHVPNCQNGSDMADWMRRLE
jgi:ribosomal protein S27AE